MSATDAQVAQLRRMVAEADDTTYDDVDLAGYIERYPLLDPRGEKPYTWNTATMPPSQDANTAWIPTYDLNAAAADIWEEKASTSAQDYDFNADGGNYSRSQVYEQYMKQARWHRSRRAPGAITVTVYPPPSRIPAMLVGNLPEIDD